MEQQVEGTKRIYTEADCDEAGYAIPLTGKVIILASGMYPRGYGDQLYFCTGGDGAEAFPAGKSVFGVSLADGEVSRWKRSEILGTLKPGLLPEEAKLHLSQIRPIGAVSLEEYKPLYSGYSFLEDGRYAAGVWLCSEKEAMDYVAMQRPYQHKVMLCDRNDFCVLEMVKGELVFPDEETLRQSFRNQEYPGILGMA